MEKLRIFLLLVVLASLACGAQTKLPAVVPANTGVANTSQPKKVDFPTTLPIGHALGNVEVRNTPEANGDPSWNVGYLAPGDEVGQIECATVGKAVWVRNAAGWSVVRNGAGVYISGVC